MFKAVVMGGISNRRLSEKLEKDISKKQTVKYYFFNKQKGTSNINN